MTGFHVDPDAVEHHAAAVQAVAGDVGTGAGAEVAGAGQADFGVLIGHTLGYGITALAHHFEAGLRATQAALESTADGLRSTAATYRGAEQTNRDGITASGGGS